jgi:hypothetical protein
MSNKKRAPQEGYAYRNAKTGRFVDIVVADPAVKPKWVTVEKIRRAVTTATEKQKPRG